MFINLIYARYELCKEKLDFCIFRDINGSVIPQIVSNGS